MLNSEESRKGAMACLDAIRIIDRIESGIKSDRPAEDHWRDIDAAVVAMQLAAGEQSDFMAGFVAVFGEYVSMVESIGTPNPYVWKPTAIMPEGEIAAHRASYEEVPA